MGVAVFLEGACEEEMVKWLHINFRPGSHLYHNLYEFHESPEQHKLWLYDCSGCDGVLPRANDYKYLLTQGHTGKIIRDLEEISCVSESRAMKQMAENCPEYRDIPGKCALFANPRLESAYSADRELFTRALLAHARKYSSNQDHIQERAQQAVATINWDDPPVEDVFAELGMAYSKREFAERFFSQFDFESSVHPYFVRLRILFPQE